jgi:hypothetical protein
MNSRIESNRPFPDLMAERGVAPTHEDRAGDLKAARERVRSGMAFLVVMVAGCLFVWWMVHLIQSLLEAELFVLRANLPFHP